MLASTADKEEFGKFEWKYFERPASQQAERNNSARITRRSASSNNSLFSEDLFSENKEVYERRKHVALKKR